MLKSSKINYGLTFYQARILAYEYSNALKKCPELWSQNKIAGIEWIKGFMIRLKKLFLRKPENTSLSRVTSFNHQNVNEFQINLERVFCKSKFSPEFNIDKTSVMTAVQAPNVIA